MVPVKLLKMEITHNGAYAKEGKNEGYNKKS